MYSQVLAFDAILGEPRWSFTDVPPYVGMSTKGDEDGFLIRLGLGFRHQCTGPGWGNPTMTGDGTVYIPHMSGMVYALRDADKDTIVNTFDRDEVESFQSISGFPHGGAAFAPGMMAMASCDTLY